MNNLFITLLGVLKRAQFCHVVDHNKSMKTLVLRNHSNSAVVIKTLSIDEVALVIFTANTDIGRMELHSDRGLGGIFLKT